VRNFPIQGIQGIQGIHHIAPENREIVVKLVVQGAPQ
jgi:hypothetical protein